MLAPPALPPQPGWYSGHTRAHACPGVAASRCVQATTWTATIRWRDCAECLPHRTAGALPPGGIALQVTVAVERPRRLHGGDWPPRITPRRVVAGFEGLPRRVGVFQSTADARGTEVLVFVVFGRARPSPGQVAAANARLRAITLR